ncbi:hypothetical protein B0H14DRAFT_3864438 [Mycena olivaceomarginata]|nr:hypothetical protein B0H14DRAFT_3864438 [Mycena olivaceomarginata]
MFPRTLVGVMLAIPLAMTTVVETRCMSGVWWGLSAGFTVCVSGVRCRAAWGHGVPATVCTVRCSVPAIPLAWWRIMRAAAYCGALLTVPPCLSQLGTLSSGAGNAGPSAVSKHGRGGSSASQEDCSATAHTYTSSSSPSDAYNPTSAPYSIIPHSTSSSASVHNIPVPDPIPLRPLYAFGALCEWDAQSGESTDEE